VDPRTGGPRETCWTPGRPVDLLATLGPLRRGSGDPAYAVEPLPGGAVAVWRATRTPAGPATLRLQCGSANGRQAVHGAAWGAGAGEAIDAVPELLGGAAEREPAFRPRHPVLAEALRRWPGWRPPRTGRVMEALVPAVLEQKVTSTEARQAWRVLVRAHGEPAPGPTPVPMYVPPPPEAWRRIPSWEWHTAGVDGKRSRTVLAACAVAHRLERTLELPGRHAADVLQLLPGIGPWTAAEVTQRAHGCSDSVSVGDLHLPGLVGWALAGEPWADDARMLELLAPYSGMRYWAVRMVELASGAGLVPPGPRRAPRFAPRDFRRI